MRNVNTKKKKENIVHSSITLTSYPRPPWMTCIQNSSLVSFRTPVAISISVGVCVWCLAYARVHAGFLTRGILSGIHCDRPSLNEEKLESAHTKELRGHFLPPALTPLLYPFSFSYIILLTHSAGDCWITQFLLSQYERVHRRRHRRTPNRSSCSERRLYPIWLTESLDSLSAHSLWGW